MVINVEDIQKEIENKKRELRALEEKISFANTPLKLSKVYRNGLAYGIAYKTDHNEIEMYDVINNWPERLEDTAKEHFEEGWEGNPEYPLYIIGLKPEKVIRVITS